ncbi:MAG TPA: hypothetical protein VM621_13355 [Luteibacter sp.]|uniref:hypothetical protein n=1 Tax=Luteibacter sp. TaxID=1886636 RepID=UPI002C6CAB8A|nr:hypothetical protein [Luteibacter sp.]HVI56024.1 hypothetical protein [Luteibacter sp.]
MTKSLLISIFIASTVLVSSAVCSSDLPGQWALSVENPRHRVVATLDVEFTDEQAPSCLGGEWKVVKVVSATTRDDSFFPTSDPLSYRIEDKQLTIGRNEWCDAYLLLKGPLEGPSVSGDYFAFGMGGSTPLGYFKLTQAR